MKLRHHKFLTWLIVATTLMLMLVLGQGQAPGGGGEQMTFLQLLLAGGLGFMIPIALCSLIGVAVIIERLVALRRSKIIPSRFLASLKAVYRGPADRQAALRHCRADGSPVSRVVAVGIRKMPAGVEAVEQGIEDAGANEVAKLRRNLRILYGVSAITPMIGLLGTVWGMIEAFQEVQGGGMGKTERLAGGIYLALVTTFAGLTVAIPILVFYYYFLSKIDRIISDLNDTSEEFIEHFLMDDEGESIVAPRDASTARGHENVREYSSEVSSERGKVPVAT